MKPRAKWQNSKYPNDKIKFNQLSNKLKKLLLQPTAPYGRQPNPYYVLALRGRDTRMCCLCVFVLYTRNIVQKCFARDNITPSIFISKLPKFLIALRRTLPVM
ncbi:G PROTEIN RECEP F1 2 domain-containing protein [Aphis craccivora]|uniref:G PROTEIN RECEP F1 2 domain-containing protein n=1 Tax=Aphis craccivora TaxID=307492 RepID=A0A6G0YLA5_APHCR|nr:G PROTEIN RECEP F1 2 domain-containing protein [Aphis craccivora]